MSLAEVVPCEVVVAEKVLGLYLDAVAHLDGAHLEVQAVVVDHGKGHANLEKDQAPWQGVQEQTVPIHPFHLTSPCPLLSAVKRCPFPLEQTTMERRWGTCHASILDHHFVLN